MRVGVLWHGEEAPTSLIDGLAREIIEAFPINTMNLGPRPEIDVLLLWLAPRTPAKVLREMIAWALVPELSIGLLGCAPRGDTEDAITALEVGVDDFVAGRNSVRELASRIHALRQRRARPPVLPALRASSELVLDARAHEVKRNGRIIRLSSTEVMVLQALLDAAGAALSRVAILDIAWGDDSLDVGERAVDNVLLRLRRKLGDPTVIETVRGVGFRLALET